MKILSLDDACQLAQRTGQPIVIFVGQPVQVVDGAIVTTSPALVGTTAPAVVIGRRGESWPVKVATLPGRVAVGAIRAALRPRSDPPPVFVQPVYPVIGGCGPGGCGVR